jgi:hypothetical protein
MLVDRAAVAQPSLTNRSKVSNGTQLLPGIDGRSPDARRFRDLVASFAADLGGMGALSEAEMAIVRAAAAMTAQSERTQAAIVNGSDVDAEQLTRLMNSQQRALRALDAMRRRRATKPKPTLRERLVAEAKVGAT